MAPRHGVKAPIILMMTLMLAALAVWPGKAQASHDSVIDPWPGEPGFHGFVPGHEMDYILEVFWHPKEWTRIGLQDFQACGDMRIGKDGEIHYTKYGTKLCSNKERYRLVEANPNQIVLFIDNLLRSNVPPGTKEYVFYSYWVLSHEAGLSMKVHKCGYRPPPNVVDYVGPAGFTMSQQDLLDKWNKSVRCNPKLLSPDRYIYWADPDYSEGYSVIKTHGNPAYKGDRFIYE